MSRQGPDFRLVDRRAGPSGGMADLGGRPFLVPVDGEPAMAISKMHAQIFDLEHFSDSSVFFTYVDGEDPSQALQGGRRVGGSDERDGVGADSSSMARRQRAVWQWPRPVFEGAPGTQQIFDRLRAVKDADEVANLRRASEAHDAGYRVALVRFFDPVITVAEAGYEIVRAMVDAGSEELAIAGSFLRFDDLCAFTPG